MYSSWSPLAPIIELAYQTGMRRGEIAALWRAPNQYLDRTRRLVQFPPGLTKNSRSMPIPLNSEALAALTQLYDITVRLKLSPWCADTITHRFRALCRQLRITAVFHDLRHTFASRVDSATIRPLPKTKSALMQHSDPHVAERTYTHPDLDHMRAVINSLPE